jgi:hypothetical protein
VALVFIFAVEDIDADSWSAEVAAVAGNRQEAYRRLRDAGLHKKQIRNMGRPVRTEPLATWDMLSTENAAILRRRLDDTGWTAWELVPEGTSLDWRISGAAQRAPTLNNSPQDRIT